MEITLEKKSASTGLINLHLQEADYLETIKKKLKELAKTASIKGFRPGKVPTSLIEKMYGKQLKIDAINDVIGKSVDSYINESKIELLGTAIPVPTDADFDTEKDFTLQFEIGFVPEFTLPNIEEIVVESYRPLVDDSRVTETIERLRKQNGETSSPDVSEEQDYLYGDLTKAEDAFNTPSGFAITSVLEAARAQFIGVKKGDFIKFDINAAFDKHELRHVTGKSKEEVEALNGEFTFEVKNINRSALAELTPEFFGKVLRDPSVEDEDTFKTRLKELLVEGSDEDTNYFSQNRLKQLLVNAVELDLPVDFLKRWYLTREDNKLTPEQLEKEFPLYMRDLKWNILRNKMAERYELKLDYAEVVSYTKEMARAQFRQYGLMDVEDEMLDNYVTNFLKEEKGKNLNNMYEQAWNEKINKMLMEKVSVQVSDISSEEFHHKMHELEDGWKA